jgi:hypothetical protein
MENSALGLMWWVSQSVLESRGHGLFSVPKGERSSQLLLAVVLSLLHTRRPCYASTRVYQTCKWQVPHEGTHGAKACVQTFCLFSGLWYQDTVENVKNAGDTLLGVTMGRKTGFTSVYL